MPTSCSRRLEPFDPERAFPKRRIAALVLWAGLVVAMAAPVLIAAGSPYLAYRNLPYIVGGFAGIVCLSLFVIQPLLAAGYLPGVPSSGSADGTAGSARRSSPASSCMSAAST